MDLNKTVNDAMVKIQEDGFVEVTIKAQLESTLKKVVGELFGNYSEFSKTLEKEVKEHLQIDMKHLGLAGYNLMVLNEVRAQLDNVMQINGVAKIKENMEALLVGAKPEYKLSELIEAMKKAENQDHDKDGESISLIVEDEGYGFTHIYFDPDEEDNSYRSNKKSKYSYKYHLGVEKTGKVYSAKVDDHDFSKNTDLFTHFYNFEKLIFQLFATGATLIVDKHDVDLNYEQYD